MSRRANILNGSAIPKGPTRAEVEAFERRRREEEAELVEKMKIPPRDEEAYPMPSKEDVGRAGSFLYTMNVLAQSYDGNLKALIWSYYVDLMNCLKRTSDEGDLLGMIKTLTSLKEYLAKSENPLFKEPGGGPAENAEGGLEK